jgi:hypothetical protein
VVDFGYFTDKLYQIWFISVVHLTTSQNVEISVDPAIILSKPLRLHAALNKKILIKVVKQQHWLSV